MKYEYVLRKEIFITVQVEADDEESADELLWKMQDGGELNYMWRDEALETEEEVFKVYEMRDDGPYCIYNVE